MITMGGTGHSLPNDGARHRALPADDGRGARDSLPIWTHDRLLRDQPIGAVPATPIGWSRTGGAGGRRRPQGGWPGCALVLTPWRRSPGLPPGGGYAAGPHPGRSRGGGLRCSLRRCW